jgi:hypothetical protein
MEETRNSYKKFAEDSEVTTSHGREQGIDGSACNNGIRHAVAKQELRCNIRTVFSRRSVPRCYKQNKLTIKITAGVTLM